MNNQLGVARAAEYTSNQAIIKSQKILNSASNFHLKTEQQDKLQEDHKSPENHKNQLRQPWRKPRMPYNKLPEPFQLKQKKKKNNKEIIENIDKIVKYNEYKQVQKYLDPIKLEKKSQEKIIETLENGNPLVAYQKYMKIKNKLNENFKEMQDMSMNKFKTLSTKQNSSTIKISECITLQVIKRGHNTGTIKKMLHAPTLKLLCIREEPLNSKQSRNSIKEWIMFWQSNLNKQDNLRFLSVYFYQFNYPEGAVSILTEYFEKGTLQNLLSTVITLPESVIRQIFCEVIQSLMVFYDLTNLHFGGLSPTQIMFTNDGRIKLGMGLYYHFPNINSNSIYHLKNVQKTNIFDMNSTQLKFVKNPIEKPNNIDIERSYDIFKVGLIVLECAIGGFQNFQQSALLQENIKSIFSEEGQRQIERDNVCCVIHSQTYLLEYSNMLQQNLSRRDKIEVNKVILYMKFLKDRFSTQFINFLCISLKLSHQKRATIKQLQAHSFLKNDNKDTKTVKIQMADLLLINGDWGQEFIQSTKQQKLDKFIGHILHVLNDCRKEVLIDLVTNEKNRILNLAKNIGVGYMNLGERLYEAIVEMIKTEKRDFNTSL